MTIAFDAATSLGLISAGGAGSTAFPNSHTPVGTPRGVLVFIVTEPDTDIITSVDYGGDTMTEVATFVQTAGSEHGVIQCFFLGASVPTGTQVVTPTYTAAGQIVGSCHTVTAADDTAISASASAEAASGSTATVNLPLPNSGGTYAFTWTLASDEWAIMAASVKEAGGDDVFIAGALWCGNENTTPTNPGAGQTLINEFDIGAEVAGFSYVTDLQSDPEPPPVELGLHGALELNGLVLPVRRHDGGQYREYGIIKPYQDRHRPHVIGRKRVPDE